MFGNYINMKNYIFFTLLLLATPFVTQASSQYSTYIKDVSAFTPVITITGSATSTVTANQDNLEIYFQKTTTGSNSSWLALPQLGYINPKTSNFILNVDYEIDHISGSGTCRVRYYFPTGTTGSKTFSADVARETAQYTFTSNSGTSIVRSSTATQNSIVFDTNTSGTLCEYRVKIYRMWYTTTDKPLNQYEVLNFITPNPPSWVYASSTSSSGGGSSVELPEIILTTDVSNTIVLSTIASSCSSLCFYCT